MLTFPTDNGNAIPTFEDASVLRAAPSQQHRKVTLDERQDNEDGSVTVAALGSRVGASPSLLQLGPAHLAVLRAFLNDEELPTLPIEDQASRMLVLTGSKPRYLTRMVEADPTVEGGGLHMRFVRSSDKEAGADVYLCVDDLEFLLEAE